MEIRINEHQTGKESNVYDHMHKYGHKMDWENIKILDQASDDQKLLLKEMLYINKYKPTINIQKQSYVFSMMIGRNVANA